MPSVDSPQYKEFVTSFYVGLAGLQTGEDTRAKDRLTQASQLAPGEPATWANLALLSVRQQEFDPAYDLAEKARVLAPDSSRLEELLGLIEARRGKIPEAIAHLRKAVALDARNVKALYALAEQTERQGSADSSRDAEASVSRIIALQPRNLAAHVERARLAAKSGDRSGLRESLAAITAASGDWPPEIKQRLTAVSQIDAVSDPRNAAIQITFLRNVLARVPAYRRNLDAVKTPSIFVGDPFVRFLKLPNLDFRPAAPDTALAFSESPLAGTEGAVEWLSALSIDPTRPPQPLIKVRDQLTLPGGQQVSFPGAALRHSVLAADLNYGFRNDLILANDAGVRIYMQKSPGHFTDETSSLKIPPAIANAPYTGAWAFDVDLDGDLDIVLGAASGEPVELRNNGDGSFAIARPFPQIDGMYAFSAADVDQDGDPDVAIIDAHGRLHLFLNERLGQYREVPVPSGAGNYVALMAADINGNGSADFAALRSDGAVDRISSVEGGTVTVSRLIAPGGLALSRDNALLAVADFDNNGAIDVLAGSRLFLGDGHGFISVRLPAGTAPAAVTDINLDGRLDIIGLSKNGKAVRLINQSSKNYHWQNLTLRAANGHGDQRINSFGIGGEVEVRAGLLTQKQIISAPLLHFGLGNESQTDVARIVWPNGSMQAEFELKPNQTIKAEQRLKGSCPSLFAWNGTRFQFVKDGSPWSPALGLHINAQKVANVRQTEEWFKLPGEALQARDSRYDLRITAELWETFYIDHYALRAVDHPEGTEIYTDERFSVPGPPLRIFTVRKARPFASAVDDRGTDVGAVVRDNDARYLDTFGRGRYQGITRDHYVELTLPDEAPASGKLYLIASGWLHPTDATVNIALGQSSEITPKSLSIEVPDAHGNWTVARKDLGFLAGKTKTAVIDITGIFPPGAPRKLRLGTNMEIYWDRLAWAPEAPVEQSADVRVQDLPLSRAELHYRGFSRMQKADASSPEIPDYDHLEGTAQRWRDLEGYATRFGDVKPLLERVDDRYVIQNAGDELRLEFPAAGTVAAGYRRDFVMIGDGWVKDGDYNSTYSKTVLPLPYHRMKDYSRPLVTLEQDPAYRLHPDDWSLFHTRYVTAGGFVRALWNMESQ